MLSTQKVFLKKVPAEPVKDKISAFTKQPKGQPQLIKFVKTELGGGKPGKTENRNIQGARDPEKFSNSGKENAA